MGGILRGGIVHGPVRGWRGGGGDGGVGRLKSAGVSGAQLLLPEGGEAVGLESRLRPEVRQVGVNPPPQPPPPPPPPANVTPRSPSSSYIKYLSAESC